jgi:hypothetical protein
MNMNKNQAQNSWGTPGGDQTFYASPGHGFCVTVLATTEKGTTAALNAAKWLAADLDAKITILKMEVVPFRFLLYGHTESLKTTISKQHSLVRQSDAREEDVDIQIRLCRDFESGLQRVLRRRALVVIGGRRRWWVSGEEKLERALRRLGHHVIFIDVRQKSCRAANYDNLMASFSDSTGGVRKQEFIERPLGRYKDPQ